MSLVLGSVLVIGSALALPSLLARPGATTSALPGASADGGVLRDAPAPAVQPDLGAIPRPAGSGPASASPTPSRPGARQTDRPSRDRDSTAQTLDAPPVSVAGFPGADTTGWQRLGVSLARYTGPSEITRAGTVIDSALIEKCLNISAKNVKITRSKLVCSGTMLDVEKGGSLTVSDSELDGRGSGFVAGYDNYTLLRVNIHNINEGPRVGNNVIIQDSWIHDLTFGGRDGHQDVLQTNGGSHVIIRNNRLEATSDRPSSVPSGFFFNAVFMVGAEFGGPTADILFEGNLVRGGDYSINIRNDPNMRDLVFRNNEFSGKTGYGPATGTTVSGVRWDRSTNVYQGTDDPVRT